MEISVSIDNDDREVLAIYLRLRTGKVHRTVELSPGDCYVDEDQDGNPLGVEMLSPGQLKVNLHRLAETYRCPEIPEAIEHLRNLVAV